MLERLKEMLKDAIKGVEIRENTLLEYNINFEFDKSEYNAMRLKNAKEALAEKVNFVHTIDEAIHEMETGEKVNLKALFVTGETVQSPFVTNFLAVKNN